MSRIIICELCGENNIVKQEGEFVCTSCGAKYSVEEARKLIGGEIAESSTVNVSASNSELEKLLQNGETFISLEEWDRALATFEEATKKYPEDYRGWWGAARACSFDLNASRDETLTKNALRLLHKESWNSDSEGVHFYYHDAINEADDLAQNDYLTNKYFVHAWELALKLINNSNTKTEIQNKGDRFINEHKKYNCQKVVDSLYTHPQDGMSSKDGNIVEWQASINRRYKRSITFRNILYVLCSLMLVPAVALGVGCLAAFFLEENLTGIMLLVAAVIAGGIGGCIFDRFRNSTYIRNLSFDRAHYVQPANKRLKSYYIHKDNLDKMKELN